MLGVSTLRAVTHKVGVRGMSERHPRRVSVATHSHPLFLLEQDQRRGCESQQHTGRGEDLEKKVRALSGVRPTELALELAGAVRAVSNQHDSVAGEAYADRGIRPGTGAVCQLR